MENTEKGKYRHYKGREYELLHVAMHSETLEKMAVYRQLYGEFGIWVRPYAMFMEKVMTESGERLRFEKISD